MIDDELASRRSGVAVVARDGSIIGWSEGATRLLGHGGHQAVGQQFGELVVPDWARPSITAGLDAIWSGSDPGTLHRPWDVPVVSADGTPATLEVLAERVRFDADHEAVVIAFAEPRPTTDPERSGEDLLRTLFDRAPEVITVTRADGRQLMVNSAGLRLLGYDPMLQRPPDGRAFVHPEDQASITERQRRIDLGEQGVLAEPIRFRVRSGTNEWRWLELVAADLTDVPEVRGRVHFSRDVTEAEERAISLRRSETRLQVLIESFTGPALLHDEDGYVINANDQIAQLTGAATAGTSLAGTPAWDVLVAIADLSVNTDPQGPMRAALEVGEGTELDVDLRDGRSFEITYVPIGEEDRRLGGLWMLHDASERRMIERRRDEALALEREARGQAEVQSQLLRQADHARNEFLASISHELRTPLTSISSAAELLLEATEGEPPTQDYVRMIARNAERLRHRVEDLLLVGRLDEGMLELELIDVPLLPLVNDAVDALQPFAQTLGVHLRVEAPISATATIDAQRMAQVLDNALSNAIRHSPPGSPVAVRVTVGDDRWELIVDDAGPGIPVDEREAVFDRFHQLPTSGPHGGAGLGLPIVRGIVELHGGRVHVEDAPSGGARLVCAFPR